MKLILLCDSTTGIIYERIKDGDWPNFLYRIEEGKYVRLKMDENGEVSPNGKLKLDLFTLLDAEDDKAKALYLHLNGHEKNIEGKHKYYIDNGVLKSHGDWKVDKDRI